MKLKDLVLVNYLLWEKQKKIPLTYILENEEKYILIQNSVLNQFLLYRRDKVLAVFCFNQSKKEIVLEEMVQPEEYIVLEGNSEFLSFSWVDNKEAVAIVIDHEKNPLGIIESGKVISLILSDMKSIVLHRDLQLDYYNKIINTIEEEILVTDEYGFIQFVNPWAIKVSGISRAELIGKHMLDYEKTCISDTTSVALDVLKDHKKVHKIMKMNTGRTLLATGVPIYDKDGKLTNALSSSKDVDEITNLFYHLTQQEHDILLKKQEQEIIQLKERIINKENYIMVSEPMQDLQNTIIKIAPKDVSILIEGESGVGKEVICNLIHRLSLRYNQPLVKINCGAIPEHLLESELFGYEQGAFTGANKGGKTGIIELAHNGTIFLDEIGEMSLPLQVKLLEFLQDRQIIRVGGIKKIPIDTRVIAATNRNLRQMVTEGRFRGDLYYRLNVVPLTIPPLRKRKADLIPLALLFLERFNRKYGLNKNLSRELLQALFEYDWPGNVRELMHVIERLVLISENDSIELAVFKSIFDKGNNNTIDSNDSIDVVSLRQAKSDFEFQLVRKAYEKFHSTYKAANVLGINQSTVVKILNKNGYRKNNSERN